MSVIQTWTGNQSTDVGQYHTDSTQSITMASYSWELRASLLRREGVESGRKPRGGGISLTVHLSHTVSMIGSIEIKRW